MSQYYKTSSINFSFFLTMAYVVFGTFQILMKNGYLGFSNGLHLYVCL
jgi:hypothetical protein